MGSSVDDVVRRLAAFGALTRATGVVDAVTAVGDVVTHDDGGGNWVSIRRRDGRILVWGLDRNDFPALDADAARAVLGDDVEWDESRVLTFAGGDLPETAAGARPIIDNWSSDDGAALELADWLDGHYGEIESDAEVDEDAVMALVRNPFGRHDLLRALDPDDSGDAAAFLAQMRRWLDGRLTLCD